MTVAISKPFLRLKRRTVSNKFKKKSEIFLFAKFFSGGLDVDLWTFQQLVDLVREYKTLKKQALSQSNFTKQFSKQSTFQNQDLGTPKCTVKNIISFFFVLFCFIITLLYMLDFFFLIFYFFLSLKFLMLLLVLIKRMMY